MVPKISGKKYKFESNLENWLEKNGPVELKEIHETSTDQKYAVLIYSTVAWYSVSVVFEIDNRIKDLHDRHISRHTSWEGAIDKKNRIIEAFNESPPKFADFCLYYYQFDQSYEIMCDLDEDACDHPDRYLKKGDLVLVKKPHSYHAAIYRGHKKVLKRSFFEFDETINSNI